MPQYLYVEPDTGKIVEITQGMNDEHVFFDETGKKWNRVFTVPNASIDTINIDPFSQKDFLKKTAKAGTVGSLMDRSKEMSEKRKDKAGYDPIQQKFFKDYSKSRRGRKHSEEIKLNLKDKGIIS